MMDINSYKQGPRTAGISIFHDGLPKLTSVHCYDRGNVATFGLQSCQSKPIKHPPGCYPIRPIPNHIKPKGPFINQQRMYAEHKRPLINQSKVYTGAFYPPGSQPRLQFVDGRPIIIPSTFENKFISKECFDPSINKSKSVIYNEPVQYSNCCKQYASLDNAPKCTDYANNRPVNCMPELSYNCPYIVGNDTVKRGMSNQDHNPTKPFPFPDALHRESLLHQPCKPGIPAIGCAPRNHSIPYRPGNNNVVHDRRNIPIVIDLDKISDSEKGMKNYTNTNDTVNKVPNNIDRPSTHNVENLSNRKQYHNHVGVPQTNNVSSFRCNSCQQDVTLANSHTYIDDSSKTSSGYNFTSTLLCNECVKKNRMWDSMRNLPTESHEPRRIDNSRNDGNFYNSDQRVNRSEYSSREYLRNKHNMTNRSPVVIDLENPVNEIRDREGNAFSQTKTNRANPYTSNFQAKSTLSPSDTGGNTAHRGTPNCPGCNRNTTSLKDTQSSLPCSVCSIHNNVLAVNNQGVPGHGYNKPGMSNVHVSSSYFNSHKDKFVNGNRSIEKPIVINLENLSDVEDKSGRILQNSGRSPSATKNTGNQETNIKTDEQKLITPNNVQSHLRSKPSRLKETITVKTEVMDYTTILLQMDTPKDEECAEISLELDIDEQSFDSFINNAQSDTCLSEYALAITPTTTTNCLDDRDKSQQPDINELSRKRKSDYPILQTSETIESDMAVSDNLNEGASKSNPTSPSYLINEEQLQKFRNKVVPVLKAKKWIRESSLDNES